MAPYVYFCMRCYTVSSVVSHFVIDVGATQDDDLVLCQVL